MKRQLEKIQCLHCHSDALYVQYVGFQKKEWVQGNWFCSPKHQKEFYEEERRRGDIELRDRRRIYYARVLGVRLDKYLLFLTDSRHDGLVRDIKNFIASLVIDCEIEDISLFSIALSGSLSFIIGPGETLFLNGMVDRIVAKEELVYAHRHNLKFKGIISIQCAYDILIVQTMSNISIYNLSKKTKGRRLPF